MIGTRIFRRSAATAIAGLGLLVAFPATGGAASFGNFFAGSGGAAGMSSASDAPGDSDGQSAELKVPRKDSFAGFQLNVSSTAPSTPPSFSFQASAGGPSEGSPRLVITFSDGDNIRLSPDTWTKGAWTRVDGGGDNWSDAGLSGCAALQDASYQQALSCQQRKGAHVTGAFVVTDGLSSVSNVIVFVDSVTYGGSNITSGIAQNGPAKLSSTRLTVSSRTGRGSLNTGCNVLSGDSCHYSLILRAGGHTIGRLTGTIDGGLTGNLSIRLNSRGIALLRRNRVVHAVARGTQINDVGFGFQVNKRVTITR